VTLAGSVDWYYQKKSAEEDVRKLSGVRGVINGIEIKPRVQAENVKRKIEEALKRHAEIEANTIRVTVHDNNKVLLEGKVNSWDERYAVEDAAWSAVGVKSVEDRLTIS
jgi:osmotically-inducible protein OsmY